MIASVLRDEFGLYSTFAMSDLKRMAFFVLKNEFPFYDAKVTPHQYVEFSEFVENLVDILAPDLVIFDCSPVPWLLTMSRLSPPCVYVTNEFLTARNTETTFQDQLWQVNLRTWNRTRAGKRLRPLSSVRDLYEKDRVLLADPDWLISDKEPFPKHYVTVGPISWEPTMPLPECLQDCNDLLYICLGSTGVNPLPEPVIRSLIQELRITAAVYVGPGQSFSDGLLTEFAQLPGSQVMKKSKLALVQGGTGSTYQAFAQGVPVLLWPSHRNHELFAQKLERFGVGRILPPHNREIDSAEIETWLVKARKRLEELDTRPIGAERAAKVIAGYF